MKLFLLSFLLTGAVSSYGQAYWQQSVATKIDVRLDDRTHFLYAHEELDYTNNSPDTLQSIYMHLWPNAYKNDHTPFAQQEDRNGNTAFYYSKPADKGYIDSLDFTVDGKTVDFFIAENTPDIARIDLSRPLLPHQTIKIATPFLVKIPKVFSRMGHTGQAYFISQWFPKPAVYDQKGWHPLSYLDQGEFYSNYGSYDVSITVPKNYIVMATGNCLDEQENKWLDSLAKIVIPNDSGLKLPSARAIDSIAANVSYASSLETKTLHYHEDNIHDFAWFADKRWRVRKDTVTSPGTNHVITVWAAFLPSYRKSWSKATDYLRETVLHYGKWVGPYPYNTMKAVLGDMHAGGGMEYPTVTVIDKSATSSLKTVVVHEAGHNWFYGMLGTNERDHAWMDEGINTFYEKKTTTELSETITKSGSGVTVKLDEDLLFYENVATHIDQPIDQTSANFTKINYGIDVYYKTALMLKYLEQYMGPDNFEKGMKNYYDTWHFKHPYPEDFRVCMQKNTPKSLDWFFDGMLHTDKKIDFTILSAQNSGDTTIVNIRNNSGLNAPVKVDAFRGDSVIATVWADAFTGSADIRIQAKDWTSLKIDDCVPDAKTANNVYKNSGSRFRIKLKPYFGLNRSEQSKVFLAPSLAYNQYDGIMLGLLIHNITLPENRFRFAIDPMYSFDTKTLNGAGSVGYVWYPSGSFHDIMLQGDAKTFHDNETRLGTTNTLYSRYTKMAVSLNFTFNAPNTPDKDNWSMNTVTRSLLLKAYSITEENFAFDAVAPTQLVSTQKMYGLARYEHRNDRTYNPFKYAMEGQVGADFGKLTLEGNARVDYNAKKKSLYVRAFLGKYFVINNDPTVVAKYELNSSYSGVDDYLYDGTYIGRNSTDHSAAQQVSMQEGGFKVPVYNNVDRSDNWMASVNLATDLPGKFPIRLFLDAGLIPNNAPTQSNNSSTSFLYDAGVEVVILKNFCSVYIPVVMSNDYQNYLKNSFGNKSFVRGISFTLQLQNINWLNTPSWLLKKVTN